MLLSGFEGRDEDLFMSSFCDVSGVGCLPFEVSFVVLKLLLC